jgi:hypothetical protein
MERGRRLKKGSANLSEKTLRSSVKRMDAPAGTLAGAGKESKKNSEKLCEKNGCASRDAR